MVQLITWYAELNGLVMDVSFKYIWKDGIFEILWLLVITLSDIV
jgi:predicted heme/steroid binding protein